MLTWELATGLGLLPLEAVRRVVRVPNPPPGTNLSFRFPGGVLTRVETLAVRFTTDITVVSRYPGFMLRVDGVRVAYWQSATQGASTVTHVTWMAGPARSLSGGADIEPWPPNLWLDGRAEFVSIISNLQPGDALSEIVLMVTEVQIRALERARERYVRALAEAGLLQEV